MFRTLAEGTAALPAKGMGAIPAQLAARLPADAIRLGCRVGAIEGTTLWLHGGVRIEARAVVVATEAPEACRLLGLPAVRSKQAACVWYAAPTAPIEGRSIVLDGEASGPVANLAVVSSIAPTYAPEGEHLIAAACPGTAAPGIEVAVRSQMMGWFGPAGRALAPPPHVPHRPRATRPAAAVPPQAGGAPRRASLRGRRSPRHCIDPGRALLGTTNRRGRARRSRRRFVIEHDDKRAISVERVIAASPDAIFDVLADPRRHAEIDGSGSVRKVARGHARAAVARRALRHGHEDRHALSSARTRSSSSRRTAAIAWRHMGHHVWRYELEPVAEGTRVKETFDWTHSRAPVGARARAGAAAQPQVDGVDARSPRRRRRELTVRATSAPSGSRRRGGSSHR